MQFEVGGAIPGRQYGRNLLDLLIGTGADRIGNLSDGYGFNPHCKYVDHTPGDQGEPCNLNGCQHALQTLSVRAHPSNLL